MRANIKNITYIVTKETLCLSKTKVKKMYRMEESEDMYMKGALTANEYDDYIITIFHEVQLQHQTVINQLT